MTAARWRCPWRCCSALALILFLLVVFDAVAYWHTRNIFDEAAAEGARAAAPRRHL